MSLNSYGEDPALDKGIIPLENRGNQLLSHERMLPKEFPSWPPVYKTFRRWQARGLFQAMYDELRKL